MLRPAYFKALLSFFALTTMIGYTSAQSGNNPPPQFNTEITFNSNTMVDFSATSGEPIIRVDPFGHFKEVHNLQRRPGRLSIRAGSD